MSYIFIFLLSLLFSFLFTPFFSNLAKKIKLVSKDNIPYLGGVAIYLSLLVTAGIILWPIYRMSNFLKGLFLGSVIIVILGLVDDFKKLPPMVKFFGQFVAALFIIGFGIKTQIYFVGDFINILITLFWIIAITNAFNLLDIKDGLAAGLAVIASITFFMLSIFDMNFIAVCISLVVAGSCFGFLRYNFKPAKIYMGDAGSQLVGFVLACLAMQLSYAPVIERKIALLTPIIILGLPIFDLSFVVAMRIFKGKSPIRKSKDHFVLRLIKSGYSEKKAVFNMYYLGLLFSIIAVLINTTSNATGVFLLIILLLVLLLVGRKMGSIKMQDA